MFSRRLRPWSAAAAALVVEAAKAFVHVHRAKVSFVVAGLVTVCVGQAGRKPTQIDHRCESRKQRHSIAAALLRPSTIGSGVRATLP